jgi:hypothetical protein
VPALISPRRSQCLRPFLRPPVQLRDPSMQVRAQPARRREESWGSAASTAAALVGFTDGTVAKINPADPAVPAVLWTRKVGNDAESIAIDKGIVWVAGGPTNLR